MKIFIDSADILFIERYKDTGLIDGITTNPTHLSKQSGTPLQVIKRLIELLPNGAISVQVIEEEPKSVYEQALRIADIHENIIVKIPCHLAYYEIIKKLVEEGVAINITLVFSVMQSVAMAKLGVTMVSPFVGRLDEINEDGIALIENIVEVFNYHDFGTEILAASLRSAGKATQAVIAGADIITVTPDIFVDMLQHPLTDKGMATFKQDWSKLGVKQFP